MISSLLGYLYLLTGCLSIIGALMPDRMVVRIIIRSKKVLNTEEYIKRYKIVGALVGLFALFIGLIIFKKGFSYASILILPFLLIIFVGVYFRDKLLIK